MRGSNIRLLANTPHVSMEFITKGVFRRILLESRRKILTLFFPE